MLHPFPGGPWHRQQDGSLTWCPAPPGVACSVILMYTFCTDCWLIAVLYFTWLAFDWNTPKKGNRSCLPHPRKLLLGCSPSSWALPLSLRNTSFVKDLGWAVCGLEWAG